MIYSFVYIYFLGKKSLSSKTSHFLVKILINSTNTVFYPISPCSLAKHIILYYQLYSVKLFLTGLIILPRSPLYIAQNFKKINSSIYSMLIPDQNFAAIFHHESSSLYAFLFQQIRYVYSS